MILRILLLLPFAFSLVISQYCDTLSKETISDAISITKYRISGTKEVFVAEVNLKDPQISLEIYNPLKLTRTSIQAVTNSKPSHNVIAAINADFFDLIPPYPVGNCVVGSRPIVGIKETQRSQFGITTDGKILFDSFTFHGNVIAKNGAAIQLQTLNSAVNKNAATLFTSHAGTRKFSSKRKRYILSPLDGQLVLNDSLRYLVAQISSDTLVTVTDSLAVLSVGTNDSINISQLRLNDTVKIYLSYSAQHSSNTNILHLASGRGRLLNNGRNMAVSADTNEGLTEKFTAVLHPRTFIGTNADTTKLFLCVVDGRQEQSEGMTFLEMANFLQFIGAANGINFDGGGSSTLFFNNRVVNSPSDKNGERPVANTVQVILSPKK